MRSIRSSESTFEINALKDTYPNFKICSYENLHKLKNSSQITNKSRFYNERCQEILQLFEDMNSTIHFYPDKYLEKIFASKDFSTFFHSQLFPFLENKIESKREPDEDTMTLMIKLCSSFLNIGLAGIIKMMPTEFTHILEPKTRELFTLMDTIQQYTERIAPNQAKKTRFPFKQFENAGY